MNFIKKIVDKQIDSFVHIQFQKFSKGEFKNRAIINAKFSAGKFTINTSSEFANELVKIVAEKLGQSKIQITGAIVSTSDLKEEIEFKEIKQFQGVKRYIIENEMSGQEILNLLEKFPKCFFALSFNAGETSLKIKPKAPKSGKPGSKNEEMPKADFCKLITGDKDIVKSFVFENSNFKKAEVVHNFIIENIIVSDELKKTNDFARIREEAKRKGKIIRKAIIDEKTYNSTFEFEA